MRGVPSVWPGWRRALWISFAMHALVLLAIGTAAVINPGGSAPRRAIWKAPPPSGDSIETPTFIDLAAADTILAPPESIAPPPIVAVREAVVLAGAPADRTNAAAEPRARPIDGSADRRPRPAADRGAGAGRPLPDLAWRRDASTLHERLTDGAEINQPSHAHTGRMAASPQAVRREYRTGVGDSARTVHYQPAPRAVQYGVEDPDLPGAGAQTVTGVAAPPHAQDSPAVVDQTEQPVLNAAQGPLDADPGARSFDVAARGAAASDDHAARAASKEHHPSITDLSLAAVSGNSSTGRGPSDRPGAVAQPSGGTAPSLQTGVRNASDGASEEARTQERLYNRYTREIGVRVNQALVWPRALAVRLEQGETVVRFVVKPDGQLSENVRVVKSSGFTEFDQAALDAVRKASPFPPMREARGARSLSVNLPVNFSNPVIR